MFEFLIEEEGKEENGVRLRLGLRMDTELVWLTFLFYLAP